MKLESIQSTEHHGVTHSNLHHALECDDGQRASKKNPHDTLSMILKTPCNARPIMALLVEN